MTVTVVGFGRSARLRPSPSEKNGLRLELRPLESDLIECGVVVRVFGRWNRPYGHLVGRWTTKTTLPRAHGIPPGNPE